MEHDVRWLIAQVALAVLKANGRVSAAERRALANLDGLGLGPISTLCEAELRGAVYQAEPWEQACAELARLDSGHRAAIVRALAEIAASDDHICRREIDAVGRVARLLRLPSRHAVSCLNSAITKHAAQRSELSG